MAQASGSCWMSPLQVPRSAVETGAGNQLWKQISEALMFAVAQSFYMFQRQAQQSVARNAVWNRSEKFSSRLVSHGVAVPEFEPHPVHQFETSAGLLEEALEVPLVELRVEPLVEPLVELRVEPLAEHLVELRVEALEEPLEEPLVEQQVGLLQVATGGVPCGMAKGCLS